MLQIKVFLCEIWKLDIYLFVVNQRPISILLIKQSYNYTKEIGKIPQISWIVSPNPIKSNGVFLRRRKTQKDTTFILIK